MSHSKVAARYAKSLYTLTQTQGNTDAVLADMVLYYNTLKENRNLALTIKSPIIPGSKKQNILDGVFGKNFQQITLGFVRLVVAKGREKYLSDIAKAYIQEDKKQKGIRDCEIISAIPLSEDLRKSLTLEAEKLAGGKVDITEKVDSSIIGGYILKVQDLQWDASVKTNLSKIREQILDFSYVPKIDF
jgi:F-type H+-transporting ATPase subunit delta